MAVYLESFCVLTENDEISYLQEFSRSYYENLYPFGIFPAKQISEFTFDHITVFYGGNGSGKTTLINTIASKLGAVRRSPISAGPHFDPYVERCHGYFATGCKNINVLTGDDVSEYIMETRYLNEGIDTKREELLEDYNTLKGGNMRFRSMEDYDEFKEQQDARRYSKRDFIRKRLMPNPEMFSNGETAMKYYIQRITDNGLFILDEPENSLSAQLQAELAGYIEDSARHFNCQFIIATHSPFFLSLPGAKIYNLDTVPVKTEYWTDLPNVRAYFDLFMKYRWDFQ